MAAVPSEQCAKADVRGKQSEAERDSEILRHCGIVEVSIHNHSVSEYMRHWETRTEKAEAQVLALQTQLEQLKGDGHSTAVPSQQGARSTASGTPRTDAEAKMWPDAESISGRLVFMGQATERVSAEFARELERENTTLRAQLERVERETEKGISNQDMWNLVDRALKMFEQSYSVIEHNTDDNNPIKAWMADARIALKATEDSLKQAGAYHPK